MRVLSSQNLYRKSRIGKKADSRKMFAVSIWYLGSMFTVWSWGLHSKLFMGSWELLKTAILMVFFFSAMESVFPDYCWRYKSVDVLFKDYVPMVKGESSTANAFPALATHVISPVDFYVQPNLVQPMVKKMQEHLQDVYSESTAAVPRDNVSVLALGIDRLDHKTRISTFRYSLACHVSRATKKTTTGIVQWWWTLSAPMKLQWSSSITETVSIRISKIWSLWKRISDDCHQPLCSVESRVSPNYYFAWCCFVTFDRLWFRSPRTYTGAESAWRIPLRHQWSRWRSAYQYRLAGFRTVFGQCVQQVHERECRVEIFAKGTYLPKVAAIGCFEEKEGTWMMLFWLICCSKFDVL